MCRNFQYIIKNFNNTLSKKNLEKIVIEKSF